MRASRRSLSRQLDRLPRGGYRAAYLVASGVLFCWSQYLRLRKYRASKRPLPPKLAGKVDEVEHEAAMAYTRASCKVGAVTDTANAVVGVATTLFLGPRLWRSVRRLVRSSALLTRIAGPSIRGLKLATPLRHQVVRAILYELASTVVETAVTLPMDAYMTLVVDKRHGIGEHSTCTFAADKLKGVAIEAAMHTVTTPAVLWIAQHSGDRSWLHLWGATSGLLVGFQLLYPAVIAPLLHSFTPLPDGPVRDRIEEVVQRSGMRCDEIFEVNGDVQLVGHPGASVGGFFGVKRVTVARALLKELGDSPELVSAMVARELGHASQQHHWAALSVSLANLFVAFSAYGALNARRGALVSSFGYDEHSRFLALQCFIALYSNVIGPLVGLGFNSMSRRLAFAADRYAVRLGLPIDEALVSIAVANKADLTPDWLDSAFHLPEPSLVERVVAIDAARRI